MTPSEELRQAAATIRERADLAEPGPWRVGSGGEEVYGPGGFAGNYVAEVRSDRSSDSRHIATWSPPIALAVAAWLDVTAEGVEAAAEITQARGLVSEHPYSGPEWDLARLINGSAA